MVSSGLGSGGKTVGQLQKEAQKSSSTLLSGAATLGVAAIISKLLGTLQKIPLQNIAGDEAFGIYTAVYPFYTFLLFLATAGIPVAVSKMVSERIATGAKAETLTIFRIAQLLLVILGMVFCFVMFFGAKRMAIWIDNVQTYRALQSVALALLIVPAMAVYRGYFQGLQQMVPTAVSQVVEQLIRVATMVIFLIILTRKDFTADWIAAGATFGSVTGALAGLITVYIYWMRSDHRLIRSSLSGDPESQKYTERKSVLLRQLIWLAIPVCLGAIVVPVLNIVDTFTVPRWLKADVGSERAAMELFGIYSRGLPLVQLLAMLVSSVSVAIVPAFAEAVIKQKRQRVRLQTEFIVRLTWLIGLGASVGLAACAVPINMMLYINDRGSDTMAILAFTGVFSMINIVTASMLQGLGHAKISAIHLLWAAVVKILLNVWWIPLYGIQGAAASAVVSFMVASLLNVIVLMKKTNFTIDVGRYIWRPLWCLCVMLLVLAIILFGLGNGLGLLAYGRLGATVVALIAVIVGAVVYIASLFRFRAITGEDLEQFPGMHDKLSSLLSKVKFFKR